VWPVNVERCEYASPAEHRRSCCTQRVTLNATRADMVAEGSSPSVRLFEASACGVPIIRDDEE
jgi:spore maturation protein CgeB